MGDIELARRGLQAQAVEINEPGVGDEEDADLLLRNKDHSRRSRFTCCSSRGAGKGEKRGCCRGASRHKVAKTMLIVTLSAVSALLLLTTALVLHVAVIRSAATRRLENVLQIFQAAYYYPIDNGFHSHHPDMKFQYTRALQLMGVTDTPGMLAGTGPPCSVTYSMNVSEAEARVIDLDDYDKELIGTIFVRLAKCRCGGNVNPPLNESVSLLAEMLRGAHVVVEKDSGGFYAWFTQMQDSYKRTSSHRSIVPMYGIPEGSVLRTLLTGRDENGDSWFQFEGAMWAPLKHPGESVIHAVNYIQYKITGRQVGPLGTSVHTDRMPIRIAWDGCRDPHRVLFQEFHPDDPTGKAVYPAVVLRGKSPKHAT